MGKPEVKDQVEVKNQVEVEVKDQVKVGLSAARLREIEVQITGRLAVGGTVEEVATFYAYDATSLEAAFSIAAAAQDKAGLAAEQTRLAVAFAPVALAWTEVHFAVSDPERYELVPMVSPHVRLKAKVAAKIAANGNGNGKGRPGQLKKGEDVLGSFDSIAAACKSVGIDGAGQNGKALLAKLSKAGYSYQE